MGKHDLHVITGYTAVGKTELSLTWAEQNDAEIISCDSLLFYRGMNIGTAKPSAEEMARVPHHMVDVVSPSEQYSIDQYVSAVLGIVADIHSRGRRVLIVGGSGFYLKCFFAPVVDGYTLSDGKRKDIERKFDGQALEDSVSALLELNPAGVGNLDVNNPRRVFNAWVRCLASGKTVLELKSEFESKAGPFDHYNKQLVVLSRPVEELESRVSLRVGLMLKAGLVAEVKALLKEGIEANPSAARSIGYRETISFIKGEIGQDVLLELIAQNTRRLLKKQRTWFGKFLPDDAVIDLSSYDQSSPIPWKKVKKSHLNE